MNRLPMIALLLASALASSSAWSDVTIGSETTIDFEQGVEVFDLHSNGLPTRLETQGFTFYSSDGIATNNSGGGFVAWCPSPGCSISLWSDSPDLAARFDKLKSFDISSVPFAPGAGTVRVIGVTWDFSGLDPNPLTISKEVSFGPGWTTHVFDGEWETTQLQSVKIELLTNSGGPVMLDNIVVNPGYYGVGIDVLPGDEANVVYPNKSGNLPIAILSSADFDATQTSVEALRINSLSSAELVGVENVDGLHGPDLVVTFPVQESGILCNDTEVLISGGYPPGSYEPILGSGSIDASECESGGCHPY